MGAQCVAASSPCRAVSTDSRAADRVTSAHTDGRGRFAREPLRARREGRHDLDARSLGCDAALMRSFGIFVCLFTACARSYTIDSEPPREDAAVSTDAGTCEGADFAIDGSFSLHPFECRASSRSEVTGWRLSIEPDGRASLGVPDGPMVSGTFRCEAGAWVFRSDDAHDASPLAFGLRPSGSVRAELTLESVDPANPWRAWAALLPGGRLGMALPELPEVAAVCARRERWTLETTDGTRLDSGERTPTERTRPQLSLAQFVPYDVSLWDPELDRSFGGEAWEWDGREGYALASREARVCAVANESLTFSRRGGTWTVDVAWHVPDTEDLDRDGDREDELVRRSRYELTAEACR